MNRINEFFVSNPRDLSVKFDKQIIFEDLSPLTSEHFSIPDSSEESISKIIAKLDVRKSVGIDKISAKFLKISNVFIPIINQLIKKSFVSLRVPEVWKTASIKALYKSGDKKDLSNYRPISILPIISKVMERLVYNKLIEFIDKNKLLSDSQFGFRSRHSCSDAMLSILDDIYSGLNNRKKVCVVSLDIKKAFDTISHEILIFKLFKLNFDRKAIEFFLSYLSNRKQFVKEGKCMSNTIENNLGIGQGSLLGPLLFAIYINDITDLNLNAKITLYADDSSLVFISDTFEDLENKVNESLIRINEWIEDNRLTLNVDKSKLMLINISGRKIPNFNANIGNKSLECVNDMKILGIVFDSKLSFKKHIDKCCDKLSKRINFLYRLKNFVPKKVLNIIYRSIIQPIIDYGICVYGFTYNSHLNRIKNLQRRAARIITSSTDDIDILFNELKWKSFDCRRDYFASIFIYKSLNNLTAIRCQDMFDFKSTDRKTRSEVNRQLLLPKSHLQCFHNSVFYKGIKVFNGIDIAIRNSEFKTFVKSLRIIF